MLHEHLSRKGKIQTSIWPFTQIAAALLLILISFLTSICPANVTPDKLEFRRQAVQRMIFDRQQNIPLAELQPAKIVGIDVMHPPIGEQVNNPKLTIENGRLRICAEKNSTATRWVGSFNPFAVYDVAVNKFDGSGQIGMMFRDTEAENRIVVTLLAEKGHYNAIRYIAIKDGNEVDRQDFALPQTITSNTPIRLRTQFLAVGVNLFIELNERTTKIGQADCVKHFDLREKNLMRRFEFCLHSQLQAGQSVYIDGATAALSPGIGQADIRNITYEDGSPLFKNNRLWMTMTVRGRGIAHPMQGVFSIDPSVFDVRFEGLILFDRGDGKLRNELASTIIYDRNAKQWRGFTVGFSACGDPDGKGKKQIWAVQSNKEPLQGLSIMRAKPVTMPNSSEDPQVIYDKEAKKWRVLACVESGNDFPATIYESNNWDGPYEIIAGPVDKNSTGCLLQKFGNKYYALFGSKDRKIYIYTYPDLKPAGELKMHLPPWNDESGTRIWPNVIPLPEGYPSRYIALMMDRLNFPGMEGANWTYGAMYLYHANPDDDRQAYEFETTQIGY